MSPLLAHLLPFSAARIFSVNDALNIRGDGIVVTSPRIDIAGDLYFTSPTEGQSKLQDVPKQISDANAQIAEVQTQTEALQAFQDDNFHSAPNALNIAPTKKEDDENATEATLTLTAAHIVLSGTVKIIGLEGGDAEPQTLNDLPSRFTEVCEPGGKQGKKRG
jgi:hypothetical protein